MLGLASIFIALLSLLVSAVTACFTLIRRGKIEMTQPTVIFLGPDGPKSSDDIRLPKIYLRTLLFATSKRGRVIQSMHVTVSRNETRQNFNIWVYGERGNLVRGSGLFVGETGIAAAHPFLAPRDGHTFRFTEGFYTVELYMQLLGEKKPSCLFSQSLEVTRILADALKDQDTGLYFDWGPDSLRYLPHVDTRPPSFDGPKI